MTDYTILQKNLGVSQDNVIGRNTLRALFARMGASPSMAGELGLAANIHFRTYGILDNGLRLAHFMAQTAHESGGFRYMEEIASGAAYENRADLGNVMAGDGRRYKGRGPIQGTGRANYRYFGQKMGVDLEAHPEILALPSIGLWFACEYWKDRDLNKWADADDATTITKKVNGGLNGFADRMERLKLAKVIIGV